MHHKAQSSGHQPSRYHHSDCRIQQFRKRSDVRGGVDRHRFFGRFLREFQPQGIPLHTGPQCRVRLQHVSHHSPGQLRIHIFWN